MRFQLTLGGPINDIILHVKMHDNSHKAQQESLGILGVNLIYSAYFHHVSHSSLSSWHASNVYS